MCSNLMAICCIGLFLVIGQYACQKIADEIISESPGPTPTPSSRGHETRTKVGGETGWVKQTVTPDLTYDQVLRKLSSCCRYYQTPDHDSHTFRTGSEANNNTLNSSCNSLLLATFPRRLCTKNNMRMCRKLVIKVCSILDSGTYVSYENRVSETYNWLQDNTFENNTNTHNTFLATGRIKRNSNSDFFDRKELLEKLNELAILDAVEMDEDFGPDIKTEILDSFINAINSENMAMMKPVDYLALGEQDERKYDFNESSHFARSSRSKRVKVRSDFNIDGKHKEAQRLVEDKLMRKLQHGSKVCALRVESILLAVPGCVPKSIIATRCQGSCPSWSTPEWKEDNLVQMSRCTCCTPLQFKTKIFPLDCPSRTKRHSTVRQISVPYPFKCMCRPCENAPDIKAEQPYDY